MASSTDAFSVTERRFDSRKTWYYQSHLAVKNDLIRDGESSTDVRMDTNSTSSKHHKFVSPLLEFGYLPAIEEFEQGLLAEKPLLLYLPGFDGTYLSAFFQYPELHTIFDVRCLVSTMDDRSTLDELKTSVINFLVEETTLAKKPTTKVEGMNETMTALSKNDDDDDDDNPVQPTPSPSWPPFLSNMFFFNKGTPSSANNTNNANSKATTTKKSNKISKKNRRGRPIYLAGESFGGILACDVALTLLEEDDNNNNNNINLKGLILINAATCYDRSKLAAKGPPVARLPPLLYVFGILKLLRMFLDDVSLPQLWAILQGKALPSIIDNPTREAYMGRLAFTLPTLLKYMPQETFQWRLEQWLEVGCNRMAIRLKDMAKYDQSLRTLIIAGEKDLALPSIAEAERLAQKLPNTQVHIVDGAGHANTCGSRLDMAAVIRNRFEELRVEGGRIEMKPVAAKNKGIYFGMEPRYDGKKIGLSPLNYWSKEYYRKLQ